MDTHHTQPLIVTLVMAIILAGMATTGVAQGDDPNAQESFVASWESVTLAVTAYNPAENPDIDPLTRKNVITVSGKVYTFDANDLVAVSTTNPAALQTFDQDSRAVVFDPNLPEPNLARAWQLGEQPKGYSVELHLDSAQAVPTSLSQLDFTVDALYGQPFITVDLPLEVSEEPIKLLPNFHARIMDVGVSDETCTVVTQATITEFSGNGSLSFNPNDGVWEDKAFTDGYVLRMSALDVIIRETLVDVEGNRVRAGGSHSASSSGGTVTTMARLVLRDCTTLDGLCLRYTIAMYPYEIPVPLTVTDVAVPAGQ